MAVRVDAADDRCPNDLEIAHPGKKGRYQG
jgi:hypothetical protein